MARCGLLLVGRFFNARQHDGHARSLSRFAVDFNRTARFLDNPVSGGQAQTVPLPRALGGEERLEEMGACFLIHAHAGIGHHQFDTGW